MKIFYYRYGSIMEPDIIDTFREFGFEVLEYTKEVTDKNYLPGKAVREVSKVLEEHPCDIAFSINFFPFLSDVCNIFHIRYVSWTVDSPVMELYSKQIKNKWNRTFIFDKADFLDVREFNPDCIFYLPLGANTAKKEKLFTGDSLKTETALAYKGSKSYGNNLTFDGSKTSAGSPLAAPQPAGSPLAVTLPSGSPLAELKPAGSPFSVTLPAGSPLAAPKPAGSTLSVTLSSGKNGLQMNKFSHDVAFVGSLYSEKCPYDKLSKKAPASLVGYLDGIMAAQERVYGYYFIEELLSDDVVSEFMKYHPSFYEDPGASELLTDKRTLSQLYIANKITANERQHTFKALSEHFDTSIYTASDTSKLPKIHNRGLAKSLTEMPLIFHSSKININTTSKAIRSGLPLRIFDIMSAGGFCLSNYQSEIPELFSVGEEIVLYSSYEELIDLTQYYLTHDSERREIARAGYERVKMDYSLEKQLEKMLLMAYGQAE